MTGLPGAQPGMVEIPGGTFRMGSDDHYPEEAPAHPVVVDRFWMSPTTVTNAAFSDFVEATGYVTVAEQPLDPADFPGAPEENLVPGSLVFQPTPGPVDLRHISQWWIWTPGASWRNPEGPRSSIADQADHPVVHVSFADAEAYVAWTGASLPTEAEWERAARGDLEAKEFAWGNEAVPDGRHEANWWQGEFPWQNTGDDGFVGSAPVGSFAPNAYRLFDMTGNVWEWTTDWYADHHAEDADKPCCLPQNPRGPAVETSFDPSQPQFRIPRKVIKGGSFLCADNYCRRYRPAARRPQMVDTGMSHCGIRTVVHDAGPDA